MRAIQKKDTSRKANTKHSENLRYMNARVIRALAATDFKMTFRTMHQLISQSGTRLNGYVENLDESADTSTEV